MRLTFSGNARKSDVLSSHVCTLSACPVHLFASHGIVALVDRRSRLSTMDAVPNTCSSFGMLGRPNIQTPDSKSKACTVQDAEAQARG